MDQGGKPVTNREKLESIHVQEYKEHGALAFESELGKKRWEYYEQLEPV